MVNELSRLNIDALVSTAEQAAVALAAQQLGDCLSAASNARVPVDLRFCDPASEMRIRPGSIVLASLLSEVASGEVIASVAGRWRERFSALARAENNPAFLVMIFRCVPRAQGRAASPDVLEVRERIERLNLLVADLSQDTGCGIVDIDTPLAAFGGEMLGTDYRLAGNLAAEVTAHTIAWTLLSFGLDTMIPYDLQERAKAAYGGASHLSRLFERVQQMQATAGA